MKGIVNFNKGRGKAGQWIKGGNYVLSWTRWSCHKFVADQMRLLLFIFAYNLANFVRRLGLLESNKTWSTTGVQTKLIKTGRRMVRYARSPVFQLGEVMARRAMFDKILERIARLRPG